MKIRTSAFAFVATAIFGGMTFFSQNAQAQKGKKDNHTMFRHVPITPEERAPAAGSLVLGKTMQPIGLKNPVVTQNEFFGNTNITFKEADATEENGVEISFSVQDGKADGISDGIADENEIVGAAIHKFNTTNATHIQDFSDSGDGRKAPRRILTFFKTVYENAADTTDKQSFKADQYEINGKKYELSSQQPVPDVTEESIIERAKKIVLRPR